MVSIFRIYDGFNRIKIEIFGKQIKIRRDFLSYFVKRKEKTALAGKEILFDKDARDYLYNKVVSDKPSFIARFGGTELQTLDYYRRHKRKDGSCKFDQEIKDMISFNSGFFTPTDELLVKFCKDHIEVFKNVDALGVWNYKCKNNISEERYIKNYAKEDITLFEFYRLMFDLNTVKYDEYWTKGLKGKKVLVIHPFAETIKKQYAKRELLFGNSDILPEFELKTIKAIQGLECESMSGKYKDWYEALEDMYVQIDKEDYDIALIAAGAFGMFLANYIYQKGKTAIHVGGALQLLFGIKGSRWTRCPFYNEHWTTPSEDETPKDLTKFIKGESSKAYW